MKRKPGNTPFENAAPLLRFYGRALSLKRLFRQGWLQRGVPVERCESVADHCFLTALLAWQAARSLRPDLNAGRVLELAMVHELGEIGAGDITPHDGVSADDKRQREEAAVVALCEGLPDGEGLLALWREYEYGASPEADFVRQVDKLEMALQSQAYEADTGLCLPEFAVSAAEAVHDEALLRLLRSVTNPHDD